MVYVHDDILMEILSRLPVESILRFKCVCKSWYALLSLPYFVSKHLSIQCQSKSDEKLMLLKRVFGITPDSDDARIEHGICIISENNMHDPELLHLPDSFQIPEDTGFELIGHCDGLIAVNNWDKDIIVCNPATGDFRILPDSCLRPSPIAYDAMRHRDYRGFLGFGYDKAIRDYKIVRVVTFSWLEAGFDKIMHKAEVFCIGAGCWRELNVIFHPQLPLLEDYAIREPYFDGVYYWLAWDSEIAQHILISFHMDDELFGKTSIPMAMQENLEKYETEVSIGVYNDSIALYIHGRVPDCVEIWALKNIGVKESWSKQHTFKPVIGLVDFLGFWNGSDKEYLYVDWYGKLAIYNRDTTEAKYVPLEGVPDDWKAAVPYMRTLVSVQSKLLQLLNGNRFTPPSEWASLLEAEAAWQDRLNSLSRAII